MPRNRSEQEIAAAALSSRPWVRGDTITVTLADALPAGSHLDLDAPLPIGPEALIAGMPGARVIVELPHDDQKHLYEVDVGVEYWFGATSMTQALVLYMEQAKDEGIHDDDMENISISRVDLARAQRLRFMDEDGEDECSMHEYMQREPVGFLACSEY